MGKAGNPKWEFPFNVRHRYRHRYRHRHRHRYRYRYRHSSPVNTSMLPTATLKQYDHAMLGVEDDHTLKSLHRNAFITCA